MISGGLFFYHPHNQHRPSGTLPNRDKESYSPLTNGDSHRRIMSVGPSFFRISTIYGDALAKIYFAKDTMKMWG